MNNIRLFNEKEAGIIQAILQPYGFIFDIKAPNCGGCIEKRANGMFVMHVGFDSGSADFKDRSIGRKLKEMFNVDEVYFNGFPAYTSETNF